MWEEGKYLKKIWKINEKDKKIRKIQHVGRRKKPKNVENNLKALEEKENPA